MTIKEVSEKYDLSADTIRYYERIGLFYSFPALSDLTLGVSLYNIFSAKYDNNGWAAPAFIKENGQVKATGWDTSDQYEAGFAPSAPFNAMAHLSVNF